MKRELTIGLIVGLLAAAVLFEAMGGLIAFAIRNDGLPGHTIGVGR